MRDSLSDLIAGAMGMQDTLKTVPSFKYLGFLIGFNTLVEQVAGPFRKYRTRVQRLASSTSVAAVSSLEYNAVILPVLSYKVRLIALPRWVLKGIFHSTYTLLRVPPNSLNQRALVDLAVHGLFKFRNPLALSQGMLMSSARRFPEFRTMLLSLKGVAEIEFPYHEFYVGKLSSARWDAPPSV
jgi:hypothetical protein